MSISPWGRLSGHLQLPDWQSTLYMAWCLIWWFANIQKSIAKRDTECPDWDQMSLSNTKLKLKHIRLCLYNQCNKPSLSYIFRPSMSRCCPCISPVVKVSKILPRTICLRMWAMKMESLLSRSDKYGSSQNLHMQSQVSSVLSCSCVSRWISVRCSCLHVCLPLWRNA